ncbi:MAG: 50S ribosomal protein L6 [Elusimicrobiota bacterium]
MSRLGKKSLPIPEKVKVEFKNRVIEITGPLGKINRPVLSPNFDIKIGKDQVLVELKGNAREDNMLHGLIRGMMKNDLFGVTNGFKKDLEIQGLGYKAAVDGKSLILNLGFSHPINFPIPDGIKITVEKNTFISIAGFDKGQVGEIAARIRSLRKPEPYKGTGVRYVGEHIIRKAGKAAAAGAAGAVTTGGKK